MSRVQPAQDSASYAWLFDVLVGTSSTVTWAAEGGLPAGFRFAERFAVLPAGGGKSFIVSLATRRGSSSALTSYNALRTPRRRLARRVIGVGFRTGLAQRWLGSKIDVGVARGTSAGELTDALLGMHLHELFERPVVLAFGAAEGPNRKPVLQVFGTDGTPLGYVKVGWNDWTKTAVRREAAALRSCAARPMRLGVPEILSQSTWRGLDLLVTAPLPSGVRRVRVGARLPDAGVLREISELSAPHVTELATSAWWQDLRARMPAGANRRVAGSPLALLADRIQSSYGRVKLRYGSWHGDFVPWNLARLGNRLYAWDWESCADAAPVGFDALHFHFQVAFVERRRRLGEAVALAERKARPALEALGVAADNHHLVTLLHLFELFVRHEEVHASSGSIDRRFYPAVTGVLQQALALPPGAGLPLPVSEVS